MSNVSFFPPTITESVPSIAFGSPPLTGASISSIPFSASSAPIFLDSTGSIELISITTVPGFAVSAIPPSPRHAAHAVNASLPLTAEIMEIMQSLKADGNEKDDHSAIVKYYEKVSNVSVEREN